VGVQLIFQLHTKALLILLVKRVLVHYLTIDMPDQYRKELKMLFLFAHQFLMYQF